MLTVYGIKNCDSVKKALKFFKTHEVPFNFIDLKEEPVDTNTLNMWANKVGVDTLFNKRSRTYKELGLSSQTLDEKAKIEYMHQAPLLIKRPVVIKDDKIIVGFNETQYKGVFLP